MLTMVGLLALLLQTYATQIQGEYYTKQNGKLSEFVQLQEHRGFWFNPKSERQGIFLITKSKLISGNHELLLHNSSTPEQLIYIEQGKVLRLFRSKPTWIHEKMKTMLSINGKFGVCHCEDLLKNTIFIFKHLNGKIFKNGNELGKASLYLKSSGFFELKSDFGLRWLTGDTNHLQSHLHSK